jgi:diguanylate cyclase (GGDEF)-like protein
MGGEELLVIAPLKAGSDSVSLFDRLTAGVAATPVETRSGLVTVTVSIGVADATPGSSVDEILARADAALYAAKRSGRNRVVRAARAA